MQTATAAFGTMVEGNALLTAFRVTFSHPSTSYTDLSKAVEGVSVNESLTTDMPDGTRSLTGYPSRSATITLAAGTIIDTAWPADPTKTVDWLFNPQSTTSPLYRNTLIGMAISADLGVHPAGASQPEYIRKFTGTVDDYTADSSAGTIVLTCLDDRNKLRGSVNLPVVVAATQGTYWGFTPGLTAVWPLDSILRASGIHTVPPPHAGCVLYASMQGSVWPQIYGVVNETVKNLLGVGDDFVAGHFGAQIPAAASVRSYIDDNPISLAVGSGWFFQCWVLMSAGWGVTAMIEGNFGVAESLLTFTAASGTLTTNRGAGANSKSITMPASSTGWHLLAAQITYTGSTTATVKVWVDGTSATTNVTGLPAADTSGLQIIGNKVSVFTAGTLFGPIEAVQVTSELAAVPDTAFVPGAVLDSSLNYLTAIPAVTGDPWQVIQQIMQAEQGVAGFDESGIFRSKNRDTIANQTVARTIKSTASLKSISQQVSASTYANHIQVPVSPLQVSAPGWVWSAPDIIAVPPFGGTVERVITTPYPVVNVPRLDSGECPAGTTPNGLTYWRACTTADGTGARITYGITVRATQLTPTTVRLLITNTRGATVYLCTPLGVGFPAAPDGGTGPFLLIGGQFVSPVTPAGDTSTAASETVADAQYPPLSEGGAAVSGRGDQLVPIGTNPWQQDQDVAQQFANDLLVDLATNRPLYRNVNIVADPRIQLVDRITVDDDDSSGILDDAMVIGSRLDVTENSWNQSVDLRALFSPGSWLLDVPGRDELNNTGLANTWIV